MFKDWKVDLLLLIGCQPVYFLFFNNIGIWNVNLLDAFLIWVAVLINIICTMAHCNMSRGD